MKIYEKDNESRNFDQKYSNAIVGDSVENAKSVAKIVSEGVKSHSFCDISEQLEVFSKCIDSRMQYVFKGYKYEPVCTVIVFLFILGIVFLGCLIVSLGIIIYSSDYIVYGIIGTGVSIAVLLFNTFFIKSAIDKINFLKRYELYEETLKYHNTELIDDLADKNDLSTYIVVNDLKRAIKLKFIPQGHFSRDDLVLMVSDEIYNEYKSKQSIYDRYYRKLVEERVRSRGRSEELQKIMDAGQRYIDKIHESNDLIKDKEVTRLLNQMEKVVSLIFYEVDINPTQADKLGILLDYYLPTTEKILESYITMDTNGMPNKTVKRLKSEITKSIVGINHAFERILDKFYQEQEMDLLGDIAAIEVMMKQEGLGY